MLFSGPNLIRLHIAEKNKDCSLAERHRFGSLQSQPAENIYTESVICIQVLISLDEYTQQLPPSRVCSAINEKGHFSKVSTQPMVNSHLTILQPCRMIWVITFDCVHFTKKNDVIIMIYSYEMWPKKLKSKSTLHILKSNVQHNQLSPIPFIMKLSYKCNTNLYADPNLLSKGKYIIYIYIIFSFINGLHEDYMQKQYSVCYAYQGHYTHTAQRIKKIKNQQHHVTFLLRNNSK